LIEADDEIIAYFIDNVINLEYQCINGRLIHCVIKHCTFNIIKHLIDKGIDIECQSSTKMRPIHFIMKYADDIEVIKYFVSRGVNIESETKNGWRPIHMVCLYGTMEEIKYFLSLNPILNSKIVYNLDDQNVICGPTELIILNDMLSPTDKVEIITMLISTKHYDEHIKIVDLLIN